MSTIIEVSKLAGVSRTTVSRLINKSGYVSEQARKKIEQAIKEVNYHPNRLAQSLHTKTSSTVALVVGDISNPITAVYTKAIENFVYQNNYNLIVCNTGFDIEKEIAYVNMLVEKQVDGIILAPGGDEKTEHLKLLQIRHIPFVFLTRKILGINADYVHFDNVQGSYQVVDHLISLGHRNIGAIVRRVDYSEQANRLKGYRLALQKHGIAYKESNIRYDIANEQGGYDDMAELMELQDTPTAVYTATNVQAAGVIRYCREFNLKIPRDIAIGSFESFSDFDPMMNPQLTANIMPVDELGAVSAELLFRRIGGDTGTYKEVSLTGSLVIRESSVGK